MSYYMRNLKLLIVLQIQGARLGLTPLYYNRGGQSESRTLYNKNILEYGHIARNGTESMIPDTEGRSRLDGGSPVCKF